MMHVGTARTALFNWLAARATGGKFILRIDDTDQDRNQEGTVQPIIDGLAWLGLDWDEMHRQSDRSEFYRAYAAKLIGAGLAKTADNGAVLLNVPITMASWTDEVGGQIRVSQDMRDKMGDLVLVRGGDKIGQASYQFASVVDDYVMGVDFIIRGVDHLANTPKQIAIWEALRSVDDRAALPRFAHVGLIFKDGKKMSKRDSAASLLDYRDAGVDPDGMFNFLLRMGWGPHKDDKSATFIDRGRAKQLFLDAGKMRAANAGFDAAKLDFYSRSFRRLKDKVASSAPGLAPA
jgi:glutamyl-tRNA synthetase